MCLMVLGRRTHVPSVLQRRDRKRNDVSQATRKVERGEFRHLVKNSDGGSSGLRLTRAGQNSDLGSVTSCGPVRSPNPQKESQFLSANCVNTLTATAGGLQMRRAGHSQDRSCPHA